MARLGDFVKIRHGWPFRSADAKPAKSGEPRLIRIGNFAKSRGDTFRANDTEGYSGEYPTEFDLKPRELLLAMTCQTSGGEILGWPMRVPDDGLVYLHNQRIGRVEITDPAAVSIDYLEYLFRTEDFNRYLFATASGSKILHTAPTRIEDFVVSLPSLDEQRRIAGVLGALDDLIDTNARLIESSAQLVSSVFRRQFGALDAGVLSATDAGPFSAIVEILGGGTPRTSRADYWGGDIPWFSVVDAPESEQPWVMSTVKTITELGLAESSTQLLEPGVTIVSARGTVGKVALVGTPMTMNQSCYGLRGKLGNEGYFTYFAMRALVERLQQAAHGSIFDTITRATFDGIQIAIPSDEQVNAFEQKVHPLMVGMRELSIEAERLRRTRDELLPLLMSGKVRVLPDSSDEQADERGAA